MNLEQLLYEVMINWPNRLEEVIVEGNFISVGKLEIYWSKNENQYMAQYKDHYRAPVELDEFMRITRFIEDIKIAIEADRNKRENV